MFASPPDRRFRIDAWATDYFGSADITVDEEGEAPRFEVDTSIETTDWLTPITPEPATRPRRIIFVDGVQRIEVWGRVETADGSIEAALASTAVGAAVSYEERAEISFDEPARVHRVLAIGGSTSVDPIEVQAGRVMMHFEPKTSIAHGRNGVSQALNQRREELEFNFARNLLDEDALVVLDGRLRLEAQSQTEQVVGLAKTIHRNYLAGLPANAILPLLQEGQRTPVFRISYGDTTRYSWYLRLPFTQPIHHSLAGIVRLETSDVGTDAVFRLANLTAFHLPAFASRPEHDPRAPQNLVPIGALEKRLRHEMGDSRWLRRTIEDHLYEEERRAWTKT